MLTITTTARIDALNHRVVQAESALADTARQLREAEEAQRTCGQELLAALQAARDELEPSRTLAAEARASEARTRAVCDLLVRDASTQITALKGTIAELRAELEQARAGRPAEPELPEHTVLTFRTDLGVLVVVLGKPRRPKEAEYSWRCLACGADSGYDSDLLVGRMRALANTHARECRAIPVVPTAAEKAGARN